MAPVSSRIQMTATYESSTYRLNYAAYNSTMFLKWYIISYYYRMLTDAMSYKSCLMCVGVYGYALLQRQSLCFVCVCQPVAVKIIEGELIYDYCWLPVMTSQHPDTCW